MHITSAFHLLVTHKKKKKKCPGTVLSCVPVRRMGRERNRERQTDRERKWMHYLEFILARSFFAFFRAFCLSSPSFMPSEDTELSVTISTMYFFKERCSYNRQNQYMRDTAVHFMYHYLEQASEITSVSGFWCQKSVAESK